MGRCTIFVILTLLVAILSLLPYGFTDDKGYLDFETFQALRGLVPELPEAFLAGGTTMIGHRLWEKGQLAVPVTRNFLKSDLNQDGQPEMAILFKAEEKDAHHYILLAEQTKSGLSRLLFQDLGKAVAGIYWDKKTKLIVIEPLEPEPSRRQGLFTLPLSAYILWEQKKKGFEYIPADKGPFYPPLLKANLEAYNLFVHEELKGVQVKFTYFGPQSEPVPGLIFFSRGSAPDLELFKPYLRPGISYDNDGFALESLMVNPEDIREIILSLTHLKNLKAILERVEPYEEYVYFSLSLLTRGSNHYFSELLLTWEETGLLLSQIKEIISRAKPTVYYTLKDYLEMFGIR